MDPQLLMSAELLVDSCLLLSTLGFNNDKESMIQQPLPWDSNMIPQLSYRSFAVFSSRSSGNEQEFMSHLLNTSNLEPNVTS